MAQKRIKIRTETQLTVKHTPEQVIHKEILAEAIIKISDARWKLTQSGLNRRAIIVRVHDSLPAPKFQQHRTSKKEVSEVLECLELLKERYCK